MMPGEPNFRHCPCCQKLLIEQTLASGNTFGARFWTDGKMDAPMLPEYPALVRCAHCHNLLWLPEAKKFKPKQPLGRLEIVEGAEDPIEPTEQDFLEALRSGLAKGKKQEKYARVSAWQALNDPYREDNTAQGPIAIAAEAAANMDALYLLLDATNPNERILKAELARELGRFADALKLLEQSFDDRYMTTVDCIKELAAKHDTKVAEITH